MTESANTLHTDAPAVRKMSAGLYGLTFRKTLREQAKRAYPDLTWAQQCSIADRVYDNAMRGHEDMARDGNVIIMEFRRFHLEKSKETAANAD